LGRVIGVAASNEEDHRYADSFGRHRSSEGHLFRLFSPIGHDLGKSVAPLD
jgi:hypothetical protein